VLTEQQIQKSFNRLFQTAEVSPEKLEKAEALIEQLRLESPLRHRLCEELEELREICLEKNSL
jgi:hypothetical protein